jgi:hypothetical protein
MAKMRWHLLEGIRRLHLNGGTPARASDETLAEVRRLAKLNRKPIIGDAPTQQVPKDTVDPNLNFDANERRARQIFAERLFAFADEANSLHQKRENKFSFAKLDGSGSIVRPSTGASDAGSRIIVVEKKCAENGKVRPSTHKKRVVRK